VSLIWHDFVTTPPAQSAWVYARRLPEDTVPATASWLSDMSGLAFGPHSWAVPWPFVTRWAAAPYGSHVLPLPPGPKPLPVSAWRDVLAFPPDPEQACWVRRWPEETRPFRAVWTTDPEPSFLLKSGAVLPWYLAWKWRPDTTPPT
jgi:hypothetical protein